MCNTGGSGQGGGGGSSFVSKQMSDPVDESVSTLSHWNGAAEVVPVIEIDTPANGTVYKRGQVLRARWACGYDGTVGLGISSGCVGSVADGQAINTNPGKHGFTVSGPVSSNGTHNQRNHHLHRPLEVDRLLPRRRNHASSEGRNPGRWSRRGEL